MFAAGHIVNNCSTVHCTLYLWTLKPSFKHSQVYDSYTNFFLFYQLSGMSPELILRDQRTYSFDMYSSILKQPILAVSSLLYAKVYISPRIQRWGRWSLTTWPRRPSMHSSSSQPSGHCYLGGICLYYGLIYTAGR